MRGSRATDWSGHWPWLQVKQSKAWNVDNDVAHSDDQAHRFFVKAYLTLSLAEGGFVTDRVVRLMTMEPPIGPITNEQFTGPTGPACQGQSLSTVHA